MPFAVRVGHGRNPSVASRSRLPAAVFCCHHAITSWTRLPCLSLWVEHLSERLQRADPLGA
jgi:hypothetical protein